jgi:ArsR family transcriptional regulator
MIPEYETQAKVFKAFCDPKRLHILDLLRGGERCACRLLEDLAIGQSSLSYHMKILCESGIVDSRPEGKWTHYRISEKGGAKAMELLNSIVTPNTTAQNCNHCNS